jgi:3-phosphoshikimate 1-carboxyvinyltransferase
MTASSSSIIPPEQDPSQGDAIEIRPVGTASGRIRPPGSKSITNRAIVIAALAEGQSLLRGALDSEDTQVMIEAWRRLGIPIEHDPTSSTIRVTGCAGRIPVHQAELFLANSGTSVRFLSAAVALGRGVFRLSRAYSRRSDRLAPGLEVN